MTHPVDASSTALPHPLIDQGGRAVTEAHAWQRRKAGLRSLFESELYGTRPGRPVNLTTSVLSEVHSRLGGGSVVRRVRVETERPGVGFVLQVAIPDVGRRSTAVPDASNRDVATLAPCFLCPNFDGNPDLDERLGFDGTPGVDGSAELTAPPATDGWDLDATLAAGYAVATFRYTDVVPDDAASAAKPLRELSHGAHPTGALMVWAWAFSLALDVLQQTAGEIDPDRVIAAGHSRLGKAALIAAAFDDRFAAVVANQSGCAGAAPCRADPHRAAPDADGRPGVETIAWITRAFPHWFTPRLRDYGERVAELPVDQHELIALCAPRPVLLANATGDAWADPRGQFEMLSAADPVYRLLGGDGIRTAAYPTPGQITEGPLAYALRTGGHSITADDWRTWRVFADRVLPDRGLADRGTADRGLADRVLAGRGTVDQVDGRGAAHESGHGEVR